MRRLSFLPFLLLALSSCQTAGEGESLSLDQQIRATCRSFTATLRVVTPIKPTLSMAQIATIDKVIDEVQPICNEAILRPSPVSITAILLERVQQGLVVLMKAEDKKI